jgi:hypothetical protein
MLGHSFTCMCLRTQLPLLLTAWIFHASSALLVLDSQAFVFTELDLKEALQRNDVATVMLASPRFDLSAELWRTGEVTLQRPVTVQPWLSTGTIVVNATATSRLGVVCDSLACGKLTVQGPRIVWWNPPSPYPDPGLDFWTPIPFLLGVVSIQLRGAQV